MSSTATQVLFDAPGPKGRRRILLLSVLSVVAILALLAGALWQFQSNGQLDPGKWIVYLRVDYLAFLGQGLWGTLKVTALAAVVAFPLGLVLALARLSRFRVLSTLAAVWIEFYRGIPMLLVVYAFLLALPAFGVTFPRFWMLVIPMILVSSATTAEVSAARIPPPSNSSAVSVTLDVMGSVMVGTSVFAVRRAGRGVLPSGRAHPRLSPWRRPT